MSSAALINASSGMMASSSYLSSISQNVANVNTTGYKSVQTRFSTLLSESLGASTGSSSGTYGLGVGSYTTSNVLSNGTITSGSDWTDLALSGSGLFMVSSSATSINANSSSSVLYTRAGDFQTQEVDGQSYLVTSGGQYVLGWAADETGTVTSTSLSALTPIAVPTDQTMEGVATSAVSIDANIPADATIGDSSYTGTVSVTDADGNAQNLTATWTRDGADSWTVSFTDPDGDGTILSDPVSVTLDSNGSIIVPEDGATDLLVQWPGGVTGESVDLTSLVPDTEPVTISVDVYDPQGSQQTITASFEHAASGQWYLRFLVDEDAGTISSMDGADGSDSPYSIPVTFDGDGAIVSPETASLSVDWTSGGSSTVSFDLSKLTQFSDDGSTSATINSITQDGYADGSLESTAFNSDGELIASYSNGEERTLYKLAVANFTAADQLEAVSGTLYQRTAEAGDLTATTVDDPTAQVSLSTQSLETSTVDLADEMTRMIQAQQAYSSNSTLFKTADEMMQTVRDLI